LTQNQNLQPSYGYFSALTLLVGQSGTAYGL